MNFIQLTVTLFFLCAAALQGAAQSVQHADFAVMRQQEEIGTLRATKSTNEGLVEYTLNSTVVFSVMIKVTVRETISATFQDGIMVKSHHRREVNGYTTTEQSVEKLGGKYYLNNKLMAQSTPIEESILGLYFARPSGSEWVYSECHATLLSVEKKPDGMYTLQQPNNTITEYFYKGNLLQTVLAETRWGVVAFRRTFAQAQL